MDFYQAKEDLSSTTDLSKAVEIADRILEKRGEISALEHLLSEAKKDLQTLETQELPDVMDEIGVEEFKLKGGQVVRVHDIIKASIPKAKQPEAFQWLEENNHGDLIKQEVKVSFGKGEDNVAKSMIDQVNKYLEETLGGREAEVKLSVNHNTLSAFVREQLREGRALPEDLLGVFTIRTVDIK